MSSDPHSPTPNQLRPDPGLFNARITMPVLLCGAIATGLGHHFVYATLNGRFAGGDTFDWARPVFTIRDQSLVNLVGNLMGTVGGMCLSAAIGTAFTQMFWRTLRTRPSTIRRLNAVLGFKDTPANPFSWVALRHHPGLSTFIICSALMILVSVFTPGSLTVVSTPVQEPCSANTVDLSSAALAADDSTGIDITAPGTPAARTVSFVSRVIMAGAYIPPASNCTLCSYDVSFIAPALQCTNVTQEAFGDALSPNQVLGYTAVWHAETNSDAYSDWLFVASANVVGPSLSDIASSPQSQWPVIAINCTTHNATYHVNVAQNGTASVNVNHVDIGEQLALPSGNSSSFEAFFDNPLNQRLLALANALKTQMSGTVYYSPATNQFNANSSFIAWSSIGSGSSFGAGWGWSGNLQDVIPDVMQNVSLSLLSGQLSLPDNPTSAPQDTVCTYTLLHYSYNRARLLSTYGAGIAVAALCILCGYVAIRRNARPETLEFSRILASYPLDGRFTTLDTAVTVGEDGRLELPSPKQVV